MKGVNLRKVFKAKKDQKDINGSQTDTIDMPSTDVEYEMKKESNKTIINNVIWKEGKEIKEIKNNKKTIPISKCEKRILPNVYNGSTIANDSIDLINIINERPNSPSKNKLNNFDSDSLFNGNEHQTQIDSEFEIYSNKYSLMRKITDINCSSTNSDIQNGIFETMDDNLSMNSFDVFVTNNQEVVSNDCYNHLDLATYFLPF